MDCTCYSCVNVYTLCTKNGSFLTLLWGRWHCRLSAAVSRSIFSWTQDAPLPNCGGTQLLSAFFVSFRCATSPPNLGRLRKAEAAGPIDPEVQMFGGWRLGQIGWEFSRSITNRSKIIQPSWGVSIVPFLQYFDIQT